MDTGYVTDTHQFEICSLVKSLTLLEGWPHILVFGHQLARICLVKKTLLASQMSYHLIRGKEATVSSVHPGRLETPGHHSSTTKGSRLVVQLPLLPYPILSSQLHQGLLRW
uniref:Uncharacterized protein n=1 Tax=Equus asinus asinus TaxID=83772 RepID=A0A8C4LDY4_EQUAS